VKVLLIGVDGSIIAWGDSKYGGTGAPTGSNYIKIYSNKHAFAALKTDGSIVAWGDSNLGATPPSPRPPHPAHAVIEPSALRAEKAYLFE
jgi:hypothetical protein